MPGVTLTILPGVEMQFYPSVGILVLGFLYAEGHWQSPIKMSPVPKSAAINYRVVRQATTATTTAATTTSAQVRLCIDGQCPSGADHGYLELFNRTTNQWVPICDQRFSEYNARVVCRQLGMETFNEFQSFGRRWELQPTSLSRVRYWPEPFQCRGMFPIDFHLHMSLI